MFSMEKTISLSFQCQFLDKKSAALSSPRAKLYSKVFDAISLLCGIVSFLLCDIWAVDTAHAAGQSTPAHSVHAFAFLFKSDFSLRAFSFRVNALSRASVVSKLFLTWLWKKARSSGGEVSWANGGVTWPKELPCTGRVIENTITKWIEKIRYEEMGLQIEILMSET